MGSGSQLIHQRTLCLMNCREFRQKHDAYVDDTLSGLDCERMARHRHLCERCAQIDTRLRRALLVAHNLPTIRPSAGFSARLQARLTAERELPRHVVPSRWSWSWSWSPHARGRYSVIAAGMIAAAGLIGVVGFALTRDESVIRLVPVVATRPELESALTAPTLVASMPAGMPLWSAVLVAQQAPWHFASDAASH